MAKASESDSGTNRVEFEGQTFSIKRSDPPARAFPTQTAYDLDKIMLPRTSPELKRSGNKVGSLFPKNRVLGIGKDPFLQRLSRLN